MVKVMVVDDSAFMRKMLSDLLEMDERIEVVTTARNGKDAIEKIKKFNPDVITLDVEMPIMNGIEALQNIMNESPKPVIMVSSTTKEGADTTMQAMALGAFDFIPKPSGSISLDIHKVQRDLIDKVIYAAGSSIKKLNRQLKKETIRNSQQVHENKENNHQFKIKDVPSLTAKGVVAIGTSTGGPKALQHILPNLKKDFPAPILIVQHMPKGFTKSLSERLDRMSAITVKEATDGELLKKGVAYIAPGGYHLKVKAIGTSVAVKLDQSPLVNGHRPAVDALFCSLAELKKQDVMAVLLTGMGSDGTKGLLELKRSTKTLAIAESEETAIVYGMPRSAIATKQVDCVVRVEEVASTIERYSI